MRQLLIGGIGEVIDIHIPEEELFGVVWGFCQRVAQTSTVGKIIKEAEAGAYSGLGIHLVGGADARSKRPVVGVKQGLRNQRERIVVKEPVQCIERLARSIRNWRRIDVPAQAIGQRQAGRCLPRVLSEEGPVVQVYGERNRGKV